MVCLLRGDILKTLIESMREIIGQPNFMLQSGEVDYAAMTEYVFAGLIVCIVIASVFRFLGKLVDR